MTRTIRAGSGSSSSSSSSTEAKNTLVTNTTARALFLVSRGPIKGLVDQDDPLKSVYFDNTPVMSSDGTVNYDDSDVQERYGTSDQDVMSGYPSASNTYTVSTKVTTSSPYIYSTTNDDVDSLRVTIRFPTLFKQKDSGDTVGTTVSFNLYTATASGSYSLVKQVSVTDKCMSPADIDYLVDRPSGSTGVWRVKVERQTADNSSSKLGNDTVLYV